MLVPKISSGSSKIFLTSGAETIRNILANERNRNLYSVKIRRRDVQADGLKQRKVGTKMLQNKLNCEFYYNLLNYITNLFEATNL